MALEIKHKVEFTGYDHVKDFQDFSDFIREVIKTYEAKYNTVVHIERKDEKHWEIGETI